MKRSGVYWLSVWGLCLLAGIGLCWWAKWEYGPPSEQRLRSQFVSHQADYVRFVTLLRSDRSTKAVGDDGMADIDGIHKRLVPEYRDLVRKIGARDVLVEDDGSMEFELWGHGCAISSDSFMGVRYFPKDHTVVRGVRTQKVVDTFDDDKLPQARGLVANGLYVIAVDPEWYIYRYDYQ